jgi:hypothetical protein
LHPPLRPVLKKLGPETYKSRRKQAHLRKMQEMVQ